MITLNNMPFDEYLSPEQIATTVRRMADCINEDYAGRQPLFICVLNGAFVFASDLFRHINLSSEITFVRLRSYEGTKTTGRVEMVVPVQTSVKDRDVVVIEDIVDTGITMHGFKQQLLDMGASSVRVAAFLHKPEALLHADARPDYIGCEIPKKFVVGYGLDIDGLYRNLPSLYILHE